MRRSSGRVHGMAPGPDHLSSGHPLGRERVGERGQLMDEANRADSADRPAAALDPEVGQRNRVAEPAAKEGHRQELVVDHEQNAITAYPLIRVAPEGESPRVVDVVAENGALEMNGVRDLGTLVPVSGEEERIRIVEHAEFLKLFRRLVPAVEIGGRVGPRIQDSPSAVFAPLKTAGTMLEQREGQDYQAECRAG